MILAACGSNGSSGSSNTASVGSVATVAAKQVDGVGTVLVDSSGRTLYTPDEEAHGTILCTGACTAFWTPLAADGTPTAASGVAQLGVLDRPDGSKQVTADGKPLYTFTQDSPGEVKGEQLLRRLRQPALHLARRPHERNRGQRHPWQRHHPRRRNEPERLRLLTERRGRGH